MNLKKGFTLIELLVVIAIIGLLSSVVLASLNTARSKGRDATIKSELQAIRSQAEIYFDSTAGANTYGVTTALCSAGMFATAPISTMIAKVEADNGAYNVACQSVGNNYAITTQLPTGGFFCTDTNGAATEKTAAWVITSGLCV